MYAKEPTGLRAKIREAGLNAFSSPRELKTFLRSLSSDEIQTLALQQLDSIVRSVELKEASVIRQQMRQEPAAPTPSAPDLLAALPEPRPMPSYEERKAQREKNAARLASRTRDLVKDLVVKAAEVAWSDEFLDSPIGIKSLGIRTTWGEATVEQHLARAEERRSQAEAELLTASDHEKAIQTIRSAGAMNLNEALGRVRQKVSA